MSKAHILIVDDEIDILELVTITCARMDVSTRSAQSLADAHRLLAAETFDLCLTDMRLPDGDGTDLVRHITQQHPDMPVAMITAYGSMDTAVAAMKAGAFDFVPKPLDLQVLRDLIGAALKLRPEDGLPPQGDGDTQGLLGRSSQMGEIRGLIAKLARNQAPVLISGESGTGKELAARSIHEQGPRRAQPFVPVNCGAIPAELVESELFGHRRGSFTGAVNDKQGLFQAAQGGTLFLDEIADLPSPMQVKLLRAIQQKSVRPVGAEHELPVDVRIISASHRNLADEVERGAFRQDLYYRVNVIELNIPPLRERPDDIPVLAEHILTRIAGGDSPKRLSEEAVQTLCRYPFPGNVRELENVLERATALADDDMLAPEDLRLPQIDGAGSVAVAPEPPAAGVAEAFGDPPPAVGDDLPLEDKLGEIEKQAILTALEATHWNRTAAAKRLGMTARSLRYRLSKLGIE
jgi:two-component system response regulator PilR (NtrC family)